MRILGIDPGTSRIGFAIIEKNQDLLKVIDYGCIEIRTKNKAQRLVYLFNKISDIIRNRDPDLIAVEDLYFFKNQKTAFSVSEARGVILMAAAKQKRKLIEPTPLQVKQALTGYGRASKQQVQKMVERIFGFKECPQPDDVADALSIAFFGLSFKNKNILK